MLGIEQKKGNDTHLCGKMIAYAKILPSNDNQIRTPFDDMVKNGLLVLEGDFREIPEELKPHQINKSLDSKLDNLIESMKEEGAELPESIDVDAIRDRIHELSNMAIIPIPARIGSFTNEQEILEEDADIYYLGEYLGLGQAHFCLSTLPVYYQARYREQVKAEEMALLNDMISQFENCEIINNEDIEKETTELFPKGASLNSFIGDLNELFNVRVIPFLLACKTDTDYESQINLFYNFMKDYPQQIDVTRVDKALRNLRFQSDNQNARKLLELSCKKINAIYCENTRNAEDLESEIKKIYI